MGQPPLEGPSMAWAAGRAYIWKQHSGHPGPTRRLLEPQEHVSPVHNRWEHVRHGAQPRLKPAPHSLLLLKPPSLPRYPV